jgi:hypothetical protein
MGNPLFTMKSKYIKGGRIVKINNR